MTRDFWTQDRTEKLTALWHAGMSSSEIAAELGALSRNAVCGKLARLGLMGREPDATSHRTRSVRAATNAMKGHHVGALAYRVIRRLNATAGNYEQRQLNAADVEPLHVPFLALRASSCRYPYGGDNGQPITFCGHDRIEGHSYCEPHYRLCWVKPQERKQGGVGAVQRP